MKVNKNFKTTSRTTLYIDQSSFNSGTININDNTDIVLTENITISHVNEYLNLQGNDITIDGNGYKITVEVANYQGFIKNGFNNYANGTAKCSIFTAKNIRVESSGDGALANVSSFVNHVNINKGKGWICQSHFGFNRDNINYLFENCSSNGTVTNWGGGIVGACLCRNSEKGSVTFKNCYSTGDLGIGSGGILGAKGIPNAREFRLKALNCYSMGAIDERGGGIFGGYTGGGMYLYEIIANNCYTIGSIGTLAGGIYGINSNRSQYYKDYKCIYSNGKSDDITVPVTQTAGKWEDANALVTIGTNSVDNTDETTILNDVSDVWHNPDASSSWTHRTSDQSAVVGGCIDNTYSEYDSTANTDDGSCYSLLGCTDSNAFNYDSNAITDDGNCIDKVFGCTDSNAFNYDSNANINDGNCIDKVFGCTNINFSNYDETANVDDGSCITKISGSLIDGYISGANGGLYDINDLSTPIETFTTDSLGKYEISTPASKLPEVYTIKFEPGGIDISTGKEVTTELTSTSTKEKVLAGAETILNVTPLTSLVTLIAKKTEGPIDVTNLNESVDVVSTVFNIDKSKIEKDFIEESDANITGLVTQLETTTKSLAAAINNDNASESVILDSIVNFMIETNNDTNSDTIDLADETNITGIIEQVETDISEIVIGETLKENATSLISQVNTKVEEIVQDNTKSFEDIITESVQLSVSTENTLTDATINLNDEIDLISVVNNIEKNAEKVKIETIFQPVTGLVTFCNDPEACNYLEEGDCKELDCAGTCGGPAYINDDNKCIVDVIM